jgi:hypothetical protein
MSEESLIHFKVILNFLIEFLKLNEFQVKDHGNGIFEAYFGMYAQKPERVVIACERDAIIITIGDLANMSLGEEKRNAVFKKHMAFFSRVNPCGGIEKIIPANPEAYPDFCGIVDKITHAYSIAVTT